MAQPLYYNLRIRFKCRTTEYCKRETEKGKRKEERSGM
eukprot:gene13364-9193_t